jgi:hypothetical protein
MVIASYLQRPPAHQQQNGAKAVGQAQVRTRSVKLGRVETLSRRHPCPVGGLLKSKLHGTAPIVAPVVNPTNKQTYERWWYE